MAVGGSNGSTLERAADRILGSGPVVGLVRAASGSRLRILAYHGISDRDLFRSHVELLCASYEPVSAGQVATALDGGRPLPARAVWVTFDDGDPTVVTKALPVLEEFELPATMFICPGVVDTVEPFWWQVAQRLESEAPDFPRRRPAEGWVAYLKSVPDGERREIVTEMAAYLGNVKVQQITSAQLDSFLGDGRSIGNHTWDHPCLDRCSPSEQERQIADAHEWLRERYAQDHLTFAYPNGNYAEEADRVLRRLGYAAGVLFDHRLARCDGDPFALSRIRTSDTATPPRFAALVAGSHGAVHALRRKVTSWRGSQRGRAGSAPATG